jgi:hypothetical protein
MVHATVGIRAASFFEWGTDSQDRRDHPNQEWTAGRLTFGSRFGAHSCKSGQAPKNDGGGSGQLRQPGGDKVAPVPLRRAFLRSGQAPSPVAGAAAKSVSRAAIQPVLGLGADRLSKGARDAAPAQPVWQAASIWSSASSGPISPAGKAALITCTKVSLHWPRRKSIGVPRNQVRPWPRAFSSLK